MKTLLKLFGLFALIPFALPGIAIVCAILGFLALLLVPGCAVTDQSARLPDCNMDMRAPCEFYVYPPWDVMNPKREAIR